MNKKELNQLIETKVNDFLKENHLVTENFTKGEEVIRVMDRYNPQLGTYYVFSKYTIVKIQGKTVFCSDDNRYDINTRERKNKSSSVYGGSDYTIYSIDKGEKFFNELKNDGQKVRKEY